MIHFIFDVLAYSIALSLFRIIQKKEGDPLSMQSRQVVIVAAIGGAFIGAFLLGALEHRALLNLENPFSLLTYKTIVGGLLGGLVSVELVKKLIGENQSSGDLFVLPLIVGISIGRIGCFLAGVSDKTVGSVSTLPWAMDQGDGLPRHPTSLYEIIFLAILGLLLIHLKKKASLSSGSLFQLFLGGYCAFRFCLEFLKPVDSFIFGLSAIQTFCACCVLYYLAQNFNRRLTLTQANRNFDSSSSLSEIRCIHKKT